jgi:RNA polymerase sigma-70 factor (ECF subfamily)
LLNFEREFCGNGKPHIAERQLANSTLEQRQRDVYETHKHRTFSVAFYMTGSELEAEEVLENTFVRAFETDPEPDGCGVDEAMVDELRERLPIQTAAPVATPSPNESVHGGLQGRNVKRTELEEALKELPPNERIVFLLRDVEGYPAERVAELLEVTRPQVERALLSARIRLRQALSRQLPQAEAA